jgi:predicted nucleic acid-binding protein
MIVVDASAMANMLVYADERGRSTRAVMGRDTEWAVPEHWKAEVFSVLRGLVLGRKISETQGLHALARLPHLGVDHVSLDSLLARMWQLRANVSGYDAAYVALAEVRDATLITADARLAKTASQYCRVELAG